MYSEEMSSEEIVCTIDDPGTWLGNEDIIYKSRIWSGGIFCTIGASEEILCTKVASGEEKFYVQKILDGEDEDGEGMKMIYAVFMNPFLRVSTPSTLLSHCAPLSLAILWSSRMAQVLLLTSCWLPGPTWWSLARRQSTCALTATRDSRLLTCPTNRPSSWSLPGLPL